MTHRTRWPWWLLAVLVVALAAPWWWPSSADAVVRAPVPPVASAPAPMAPTPPMAATPPPAAPTPRPVDAARADPGLKLVGTVVTADGAGSFALMRRTADSQLVQLRVGGHVEDLTVSAIRSDSVVLAGAGQAVVIEADRTAASPRPAHAAPPHPPDVEAAFAGDPAPFGH